MARYTGASCRLCRREGCKLFLKGSRCYSDKCAIARRAYAPGQHGQQRNKISEYGLQLREKQKAKRFYGILEGQFRRYFDAAVKKQGVTGEEFLKLLERRLDNVVYRMGIAESRAQARQLVRHGHVMVNERKVNIPSYLVKVDDVVAVREKSRNLPKVKELTQVSVVRVPKWLEFNLEGLTCKVVSMPEREDIDLEVAEHLIVELYSK